MTHDTERLRIADMLEETDRETWRGMALVAFIACLALGAVVLLWLHVAGAL